MEQHRSSLRATRVTLLNLATVSFVVAWLAVACYALAYLVSH
jgi:hypothetical protein